MRLDRPRRRNAVDAELLAALCDAVRAPAEPVLILGSTDTRAFCAGGDLSLPPDDLHLVSDGLYGLYEQLVQLSCVILAAADGHAVGAGAQLLLCADLRVAGPGLQLSFAGARSGLAVGTWGLAPMVGRGRALDLSLTGRTVDAAEALRIGLVDRVEDVPQAAAMTLAAELGQADPEVLDRVKRLTANRASVLDRLRAERRANAASTHVDAASRVPRHV